jgi:tRNA-dihydrouridine synthase
MIGRGAIQNPWIFRHIRHYLDTGEILPDMPLRERFTLCIRHLRAQADYRGERRGVLSFRKNYAAYLKGVPSIAQLRRSLMELEETEPIVERLEQFLKEQEA